jgi:hypothetical protein
MATRVRNLRAFTEMRGYVITNVSCPTTVFAATCPPAGVQIPGYSVIPGLNWTGQVVIPTPFQEFGLIKTGSSYNLTAGSSSVAQVGRVAVACLVGQPTTLYLFFQRQNPDGSYPQKKNPDGSWTAVWQPLTWEPMQCPSQLPY